MQRLQIQLAVGLNRNTARRRALYSFCDRVRIPEVVLVTLPERFGIGWRHLFDLVTERDQLTRERGETPCRLRCRRGTAAGSQIVRQSGSERPFRVERLRLSHPGRSYAACSYRYRSQWCVRLQRLLCWAWRVLLVLFKIPQLTLLVVWGGSTAGPSHSRRSTERPRSRASAAHRECAVHPKANSQRSSSGSALADLHRFVAGLPGSAISSANTDESLHGAIAQKIAAG